MCEGLAEVSPRPKILLISLAYADDSAGCPTDYTIKLLHQRTCGGYLLSHYSHNELDNDMNYAELGSVEN